MNTRILFSVLLGTVLLLSAVSSSLESAEALKSTGTTNTKFGKGTSGIVCGDKLCSEIPKDIGRGDATQQTAPFDPFAPIHTFEFNFEGDWVVLDGDDGYLQFDRNRDNSIQIPSINTNSLDALTVTAWINPNFERSFGEYSVISKERSFDMFVDNLTYPKKTVNFGVYDGITWTVTKTKQVLPEDWFHLAATYEKDTISLYVNGKFQGDEIIKPIRMVDENGKTVEKTVEKITSDSNLVIGSYLSISKSEGEKFTKRFAGMIDDVQVFGFAMDAVEISEKYQEKATFYKDRSNESTSPEDNSIFE